MKPWPTTVSGSHLRCQPGSKSGWLAGWFVQAINTFLSYKYIVLVTSSLSAKHVIYGSIISNLMILVLLASYSQIYPLLCLLSMAAHEAGMDSSCTTLGHRRYFRIRSCLGRTLHVLGRSLECFTFLGLSIACNVTAIEKNTAIIEIP